LKSKLPEIKSIAPIHFQAVKSNVQHENIPIFGLSSHHSPAIKIEWIFDAGKQYEHKKLVSELTSKMLMEGTLKMNRETLLEEIEYYGASVRTYSNYEKAGIIMYCLADKCEKLLQIVFEMLSEPAFEESSLQKLSRLRAKNYENKMEDADFLAHQYSFASIFGEHSSYGYIAKKEDYQEVNIEDIKTHFKYYLNGVQIIVCGDFQDDLLENISSIFSPIFNNKNEMKTDANNTIFEGKNYLLQKQQQQASIRLSKQVVPKNHEDYAILTLLNTILGGYFGSRLMKTLRESKGYTYGAYSQLGSFSDFGYWIISTQTSHKHVANTLKQIQILMEKLQHELIPENELQMAKNYFLGTIIAECDGVFKSSDVLREMVTQKLPFTWVHEFGKQIESISSQDLQEMAIREMNYLSFKETIIL